MSTSRRRSTLLGALGCAALLTAPVLSSPLTGAAPAVGAHASDPAAVTAHAPARGAGARDTTAQDTTVANDSDASGTPVLSPLLPDDDDDPTLFELVRLPETARSAADDLPEGVDEDAYAAGIRGDLAGAEGSGSLRVVEGAEPAPREAEHTYRVRVEVERGLPIDREAFADYVMTTLNDDRGWGHDGSVAFERVDDADADFGVTLADGPLSIELCEPLDVGGIYSCGRNGRAVLNADRFGESIEPFLEAGGTLRQYREYLVNHEVGHLIGHQHVDCPAPGEPAPVMVQQSISLQGCVPNAWAAEE
ncbi:DUF3152 domain-containing protein [Georgenia sp. Z1344]|uniref:DUF3152 domain-containing protein n=1 Tax=Georgenia sp. Z1344 TaxID=3416706 RepID=UPI003CF14B53